MSNFIDLALAYDPEQRCCDLVLGDDFDLVLDETPLTPMFLSIGLDRRASPDDDLPDGRTQFLAPTSFSERRGAVLDGLNPARKMSGCKMWLLDRAKETETTRQLCVYYLSEGLAWVEQEIGEPAIVEAWWVKRGVLGYRAEVQDTSIDLTRKVAA